MITIDGFETFGEGLESWSYRGHDNRRRDVADRVALIVFASDVSSLDGKYGTEFRDTLVRTATRRGNRYELDAPLHIDAPFGSEFVELRAICLEVDGEASHDELLEDAAHGFEVSIGGHQPRPWHDPFHSFGSPWWTPNPANYRVLFEDCWSVTVSNPTTGGREPLQTPSDRNTIGRQLAARGITRLVSVQGDSSSCRERRRYQNRTEAVDCALSVSYSG
jgi:hypothetical protein